MKSKRKKKYQEDEPEFWWEDEELYCLYTKELSDFKFMMKRLSMIKFRDLGSWLEDPELYGTFRIGKKKIFKKMRTLFAEKYGKESGPQESAGMLLKKLKSH